MNTTSLPTSYPSSEVKQAQFKAAQFKSAMGSFLTGVAVVMMRSGDTFRGITVSSVSSVSLQPPLLSFCIEQDAKSYQLLQPDDAVSVNILAANQQDLCQHFARNGDDWQEDFSQQQTKQGIPLLKNTVAGIEGRIWQRFQAGDHDIILCVVDAVQVDDTAQPLAYFRGGFSALSS